MKSAAAQSPNFWFLTPMYSRLTKPQLEEIMEAMPDKYRGDRRVSPGTKDGMIAFINAARDQRRYETHTTARQTKAPPRQASLCGITADECNAWLRSLPPIEQV